MIEATLVVRMLSEWAVSTGESSDDGADNTIVRDVSGLPILPAKTLRGLLRDAATAIASEEAISMLFGIAGEGSGASQFGCLKVSDGMLCNEEWNSLGLTKAELGETLTITRVQTAIERTTGSAKAHSLRKFEIAAPGLEFAAKVHCNREYLPLLQAAALLVRRLGHSRSRGLGYCQWALIEGDAVEFGAGRERTLVGAQSFTWRAKS